MPAAKPSNPRLRRSHPLAQGLGLALCCFEGGGTKALDVSGNDAHATFNGNTAWKAGQSGWSLKFDGLSTTSVDFNGLQASLKPSAAITFATWVNRSATSNVIIDAEKTAGTADAYQLFDNAGTWRVTINGTTFSAGTATLNVWQHVAFTYDSRIPLTAIYVNGVSAGTSGTPTGALTYTTKAVRIGADTTISGFGVTGQLDSAFLWNRALSANDIESHFRDAYAVVRPRPATVKAAAVSGLLLRRRRFAYQ